MYVIESLSVISDMLPAKLKLEIDKGLQVGGDELVDDENTGDDGKQHGPEG